MISYTVPTANQVIGWLKKAFNLYQKYQRSKQKKQHQQQQQQQQYSGGGGGGGGGGGTYAQHSGAGQSPYPPAGQGGYPQQQQGGWTQPAAAGGKYGAHDGTATAPRPRRRVPAQPWLPPRPSPQAATAPLTLSASFSSSLSSCARVRSFTDSTHPLLDVGETTQRNRPPPAPRIATPVSFLRSLTTSSSVHAPPFRPPPSFYDPTSPSYRASGSSAAAAGPTSSPHARHALLPDLHIFHLLPSYLRPSYRALLRLVGFDPAAIEAQNQDMANAQNAHYVALRNKAIQERDLMGQAFTASKQAYAAGDGEEAHNLSVQGKTHQRNRDQLNAEAAQWIFNENNKSQPIGSVDLHGLYVEEAIEYTQRAIKDGRARGLPELRLIVGKGNHSPSHVAKIKPAISSLMQREHLTAQMDQHNAGVLVVQLQGQGTGRDAGQFMREIEQKGDTCVVM
ncbi:hypothetical protein B0A53_03801 [Rhodotorula sp. CCFEE 5036]|nr:hypothetical protein B0A53_03801 [Rhodotorula sp. CCFEE 5036]